MMHNDSIEQAVEAMRQELAALDARRAKLMAALSALAALIPPVILPLGTVSQTPVTSTRYRSMPMIKAAALVLRHATGPLHISEIVKELLAGGFEATDAKALRNSLQGSLDRGTGAGGWFAKTAPATYTLRGDRVSEEAA